MKTLLFTIEYPPFKGGVANYYGNLVKYWPEADNIFVLDNNKNKLIKNFCFPKWLPACRQLKKTIKSRKIDHIIVGQVLPLGTIAYRVSLFSKVKYSIILHGMDFAFSQKTFRKRFLTKLILNKAEKIICANSYTANLLKETIKDPDKIVIVNPGISEKNIDHNLVKRIKDQYELEDKIVMFSLSRLVRRKGHDKIIKIMPELNQRIPNLRYFIAGEGPDRLYLEDLAKDNSNIKFLGKVNNEEKEAWLEVCDFFAMPSRNIEGDFEGFGIVYMEAAMHHKPSIAGESGGVKDAVQGGITGILINPENEEQIANAIIQLATKEDTRKTLGENAYQRAKKEFRWEDKIQKIFNAINK
jgi:phosphatidylinositol alpha-1,6-mannosyltransferase